MAADVLLAFAAGYLFNEEQALRRISRNMGYAHEGWFMIKNSQALWLFAAGCFLSFIKALILGNFFLLAGPETYYWSLLFFQLGNILAVKELKGLYYTPWLALWGIGALLEPLYFQMPCTALCVTILFTKSLRLSVNAAVTAGIITVICCGKGQEVFFILAFIFVTLNFSGRLAPITDKIIRYRGTSSKVEG